MKKLFVVLLAALCVQFGVFRGAHADPRMETNNDFCHFILDTEDTDNEIFLADCGSVITVVEKVPPADAVEPACYENYSASGYASAVKMVPAAAAPLPPGESLMFTNEDTETPCTMVESNGRQYRSYRWKSRIRVGTRGRGGMVRVRYELFCNGEE